MLGGLKDVWGGNWDTLVGVLKVFWETIKGVFRYAGDALSGVWKGIWDGIKSIARGYLTALVTLASTAIDNVLKVIGGLVGALGKIKGPLGAPFRAAEGAVNSARSAVERLTRSINNIPTYKTVTVNYQQVGSITNVPYSKRAKGGPVMPGRPYLVGEEGPEMSVPSRAGHVMTAGQTKQALGSGGGNVYNLSLYGDHNVATADVPSMFRRMELLAGTGG